jgi:hypothetical protein
VEISDFWLFGRLFQPFRYTTLTSVTLFDALAIPSSMRSSPNVCLHVCLHVTTRLHLMGVVTGMSGVVVNVLQDYESDQLSAWQYSSIVGWSSMYDFDGRHGHECLFGLVADAVPLFKDLVALIGALTSVPLTLFHRHVLQAPIFEIWFPTMKTLTAYAMAGLCHGVHDCRVGGLDSTRLDWTGLGASTRWILCFLLLDK